MIQIEANDPNFCFHSCDVNLKVVILPSQCAAPMEAVEIQLNNMLFRYNDELDGVPIMFDEMRSINGKEYGRIIDDHPWIHIEVNTKILVFRPVPGLQLEGVVQKVKTMPRSVFSLVHLDAFVFHNFFRLQTVMLRCLYLECSTPTSLATI